MLCVFSNASAGFIRRAAAKWSFINTMVACMSCIEYTVNSVRMEDMSRDRKVSSKLWAAVVQSRNCAWLIGGDPAHIAITSR